MEGQFFNNSDIVNDVYKFNKQIIGLEQPETPVILSRERLLFALTAMYEELHEFTVATNEGNVGEAIDAMIDLIYFAIGRCFEMGIPADKLYACWDQVQNKNMQKTPGKKNRGTEVDAVKPEGWQAADLNEVLSNDIIGYGCLNKGVCREPSDNCEGRGCIFWGPIKGDK